jgi:hypothetical protein
MESIVSEINVYRRLLAVASKGGLENRLSNSSRSSAYVKCCWRTSALKGEGTIQMMTLNYSRTRESARPDLDLEFGREVRKEGKCRRWAISSHYAS